MTSDDQFVPELMTVNYFLARYMISRTEFYRQVNAGKLRIKKLGNATRIARVDAEAWDASIPPKMGESVNA